MGTWGPGTLENDTAQDFFAEMGDLQEIEGFTDDFIKKLFFESVEESLNEKNIEEHDHIVTACEIVASAFDRPSQDLCVYQEELIQSIKSQVTASHRQQAISQIEKIMYHEENLNSWFEKETALKWQVNLKELRERLTKL